MKLLKHSNLKKNGRKLEILLCYLVSLSWQKLALRKERTIPVFFYSTPLTVTRKGLLNS